MVETNEILVSNGFVWRDALYMVGPMFGVFCTLNIMVVWFGSN